MTYKAQLVVRASTKEGVEIIERVKELANAGDATFSDMALELLGKALDPTAQGASGPVIPAKAAEEPKEKPAAKAAEKKQAAKAAPEAEEKPRVPVTAVAPDDDEEEEDPDGPLSAEEAGPAVDPNLPPKELVGQYVRRREERGPRAAARILVDFFAVAGPAAGGKVKKLLQQEYSRDEFESLMKPIKRTSEYAAYTERAIFGAPSPYSTQKAN